MVGTSIMVGTSTTVVNCSTVPGTNSPTVRATVERVVAAVAATCTADLGLSPGLSSSISSVVEPGDKSYKQKIFYFLKRKFFQVVRPLDFLKH
jgi:hypothetical protein